MVYETTAFDQFRHKPFKVYTTRESFSIYNVSYLVLFIVNSINKVNYLFGNISIPQWVPSGSNRDMRDFNPPREPSLLDTHSSKLMREGEILKG